MTTKSNIKSIQKYNKKSKDHYYPQQRQVEKTAENTLVSDTYVSKSGRYWDGKQGNYGNKWTHVFSTFFIILG